MSKKRVMKELCFAALCAFLAGEILTAADCVMTFGGSAVSVKLFASLLAGLTAGLYLCFRKKLRKLVSGAAIIMTTAILVLAFGFASWQSFSEQAQYTDVDFGKTQLYAGKRIMLIVPHEDDEINLLGGVLEEYVKYGSEVYAVFVTNGDSDFTADVRIGEAIAALNAAGIPEEQIIFLGYGDQWAPDGPHLYNGTPGKALVSAAGKTHTYGTPEHPAYREGRAYTVDNLLQDITDVILEYRPEIIFCSDYDRHVDHRAVSLAFEKAVGQLLKQESEYRPVVLKGYAYGTAWAAEPDYYAANLKSTQNVYEAPALQEPEIYRWEQRLRLPVRGDVLSRSLVSSGVYQSLSMHDSQNAGIEAVKIINGDKVFWFRDTNSLCYDASVDVTSGDRELLCNFMLVDDKNLTDGDLLPYDGVWIPEPDDSEKKIRITFAESSDVEVLFLYDHPSEKDNILDIAITFDNGAQIHTGPLDSRGCASRIDVKQNDVQWMELKIESWEGTAAGLSEVEVFESVPDPGLTFVKLMDADGNFVYDYWTDQDGAAVLSLYISGNAPAAQAEAYLVRTDNPLCSVEWEGEDLSVICRAGECCVLTVESADGMLSDSIRVENPGRFRRFATEFWQEAEQRVLPYFHSRLHEKTILYRIGSKLFR